MLFQYNNILNLPDRCLLNKRLPKSFFLKNFELSSTEKKLLNDSIQSMEWLASIKPSTSNISILKNNDYAYEEIQVMICTTGANQLDLVGKKCVELFQKYIPYQILLFVEDDNDFIINVCDKRINQNDKTKRTIEGYFTTSTLSKLYKNEITTAFYEALNFNGLDKSNLETLYENYTQSVIQFQASAITGTYNKRTQQRTNEDMANLLVIENIEKEIIGLSNQLKKESQLNTKVNLNVEIQKKKQEIENIKNKLGTQ